MKPPFEPQDGIYYITLYPDLRWLWRGLWRALCGDPMGVTIQITPKGWATGSFLGMKCAGLVPPKDALYACAPRKVREEYCRGKSA